MLCNNCIHKCNIDRTVTSGVCGCQDIPYVNKSMLHRWEEPCLSAGKGAGAVFFSGCNLNCIFCQNQQLHNSMNGTPYSVAELSELFLTLQKEGANNIDLVTPTPHIQIIREAVINAKSNGLIIPVVYNTSGSETLEALQSLEGIIDIYLPDFKYVSSDLSLRFSGCDTYYPNIRSLLLEMFRQTGTLTINEEGIAVKGLLIRHMVLPCCVQDSFSVLDTIHEILPSDTYISLLRQYTPTKNVENFKPLNRRITYREYNRVVEHLLDLGFKNVFLQEKESAVSDYIPNFNDFRL